MSVHCLLYPRIKLLLVQRLKPLKLLYVEVSGTHSYHCDIYIYHSKTISNRYIFKAYELQINNTKRVNST